MERFASWAVFCKISYSVSVKTEVYVFGIGNTFIFLWSSHVYQNPFIFLYLFKENPYKLLWQYIGEVIGNITLRYGSRSQKNIFVICVEGMGKRNPHQVADSQ